MMFSLVVAALVAQVDAEATAAPNVSSGVLYSFVEGSPQRLQAGPTVVTVDQGLAMPELGYGALGLSIDNREGPDTQLDVTARQGVGGPTVRTRIHVGAGQTLSTSLPLSHAYGSALINVEGPHVPPGSAPNTYVYRGYHGHSIVLSLSEPADFEAMVGTSAINPHAPPTADPAFSVGTLAPSAAPSHFMGYVGCSAVVLPKAGLTSQLTQAQRDALENYVLTGGHLVVRGGPRELAPFPSMRQREGTQQHGFGQVSLLLSAAPSPETLSDAHTLVSPRSNDRYSGRRYLSKNNDEDFLLPQARPPLGRFMLIIGVFSLVMGPGSLLVARRKGPSMLLAFIPLTALVTCVLLAGYSLVVDGLSVHVARSGVTWLDSKNHRAVTIGLAAYYANLAPSSVAFGPGVVPVGDEATSYELREGLTMGSDFMRSRSYREWGLLSVEPSRARVVLRPENGALTVQNVLGAKVKTLRFMHDGVFYSVGEVADGASGVAERRSGELQWQMPSSQRFMQSAKPESLVLSEGEFIAELEGAPFVPTGSVTGDQSPSTSLVRGVLSR